VSEPQTINLSLLPASVALARHWALERLVRDHDEVDLHERVALVVSELVANAIAHGAAPITLTVSRLDDRAWIEVTDGGLGRPQRRGRAEALSGDGGLGLNIVEALADRWGVDGREGTGLKSVWCELWATAPPKITQAHNATA
jgi:anti-sigma regulatory factor (Ser/Thr protein kinase)